MGIVLGNYNDVNGVQILSGKVIESEIAAWREPIDQSQRDLLEANIRSFMLRFGMQILELQLSGKNSDTIEFKVSVGEVPFGQSTVM